MAASGPNTDVLAWGRVSRWLPQAFTDALAGMVRLGKYGEPIQQLVTAREDVTLDEGSEFLVRSPTPGTGLATIAAPTALADVSPFFILTNNNPIGGKNIFLKWIRLICTAAGTGGTRLDFATKIDNIARYSSGGSVLTPVSPNMGSPNSSLALAWAGALVATAASPQARLLENAPLRTAIPVVNDQYMVNFGGHESALDGVLVSGAAIAQRSIPHCGVEIPPGASFLLHLYLAAQSAASSYELQCSFRER